MPRKKPKKEKKVKKGNTMVKQRMGICNNCGECCGSVTSPNPTNPIPGTWPSDIRHWELNTAYEHYPLTSLFGLEMISSPEGQVIGKDPPYGFYRVRGTPYFYVWVTGEGCCKDISPGQDGTIWNSECPFLQDDSGDGSRPCALVGSNDDGARRKQCRPEEHPDYVAVEDVWIDASVDKWIADHPNCSYTWLDRPDIPEPPPPPGPTPGEPPE
jgi:hypothetical protein